MQKYGIVPSLLNVVENVVPDMNKLLSKPPSGTPLLPLVTVCAAESALNHVTVEPFVVRNLYGTKQDFESSHPGTEVPDGIMISVPLGTVSVGDGVGFGLCGR